MNHASRWIPQELHPLLAWLGKRDWLDVFRNEEDYGYRVRFSNLLTDLPSEHATAFRFLKAACVQGADYLSWLVVSRWISDGPKVFRPSAEQCEALANIELRIQSSDYAQPYPALMIVIPEEFGNQLAREHGSPSRPDSVLCYHDPKDKNLIVGSLFLRGGGQDNVTITNIFPHADKKFRDIEEMLDLRWEWTTPEYELRLARACQRLAFNANLLLTSFERTTRPADQRNFDFHRRQTGDSGVDRRRRNDGLGDLRYVELTQEIFLREGPALPRGEPRGGTHSSPKPHWRKGHWRMTACGRGRLERKRTLIKPVMVMASAFVGDLAGTQVTYKGK